MQLDTNKHTDWVFHTAEFEAVDEEVEEEEQVVVYVEDEEWQASMGM